MKLSILNCIIILFLFFIVISKEDLCPPDQICISALGKCKNISDILEGKDLKLKTENLFYLSTNNEGRIEKDRYKLEIYKLNDTKLQSHNTRKSKLYIPDSCLEKMERDIVVGLNKNKGIIIIVHDSNNINANNITNNYFIILYSGENSNIKYISSKNYDFSFCHEDPILLDDKININYLTYSNDDNNKINLNKILYGRKHNIDLFDPNSDFLQDICFKFTSEKGTDVPLESRAEDYYQNINFCNERENSHYISYNYSASTSTFTYRCAFGFYESESEKSSYLDVIDTELKSLVSVSNVKVIKCYKNILNLRDVIKNYGGMICIFVLIFQIICFLIFCFCGIKSIEDQLGELFLLGKNIIRRRSKLILIENIHANNQNAGKEDAKNSLMQENEDKIKGLKIKAPDQRKKLNAIDLDKNSGRESEEIKININEIKEDIIKSELNPKKKDDNPIRQKTEGEIIDNLKIISFQNKVKENSPDNQNNIEKLSENSQLYDYASDELNELPFEKAIKYDKRNICIYYGNILLTSHIILSVFFRYNDYNLFIVKLGLLLMTFPINLTFNIFFFTNKNIKLSYIKSMDDISTFWSNIPNTIYSSILSSIFLILLKFMALTHNSVRTLRKMNNVDKAEEKSKCILRCIKIRIAMYYLLSFIFLIVFGFYVLCFCNVFENTQIELVKSTLTSWLISILYPFIICFLTSIVRALALLMKNKYLYAANKIMQLL